MIMKRLESYIISHIDDLEDEDLYSIKQVEEVNASSVCGVTFKDLGNNWIEIRTSVDVDISFNGKIKYGYDSDSTTRTYNVFLKAILENGLCNVSVTDVAAYDIKNAKENPFRHYLDYLHGLNELSEEEKEQYAGIGKEFLALIETTDMSKVYKMTVLYSFYNHGDGQLW